MEKGQIKVTMRPGHKMAGPEGSAVEGESPVVSTKLGDALIKGGYAKECIEEEPIAPPKEPVLCEQCEKEFVQAGDEAICPQCAHYGTDPAVELICDKCGKPFNPEGEEITCKLCLSAGPGE